MFILLYCTFFSFFFFSFVVYGKQILAEYFIHSKKEKGIINKKKLNKKMFNNKKQHTSSFNIL